MADEPDVIVLARKIQYDLTAIKARLSELQRALANLDLPEPQTHECPRCKARFPGKLTLAEHLYQTHDGPEPPHWVAAEESAA